MLSFFSRNSVEDRNLTHFQEEGVYLMIKLPENFRKKNGIFSEGSEKIEKLGFFF